MKIAMIIFLLSSIAHAENITCRIIDLHRPSSAPMIIESKSGECTNLEGYGRYMVPYIEAENSILTNAKVSECRNLRGRQLNRCNQELEYLRIVNTEKVRRSRDASLEFCPKTWDSIFSSVSIPLPDFLNPQGITYSFNLTHSGPMFIEPGQASTALPQLVETIHSDWPNTASYEEKYILDYGEAACGPICEGIAGRNGSVAAVSGSEATRNISLIRMTNNVVRQYSEQEAPADISVSCSNSLVSPETSSSIDNSDRSIMSDDRRSPSKSSVSQDASKQ